MLMVMTLYMGSCAPPAMSDPRVTQMPCCSISRTGDTPLHRLMLTRRSGPPPPRPGGWRRTPGRRSGRSGPSPCGPSKGRICHRSPNTGRSPGAAPSPRRSPCFPTDGTGHTAPGPGRSPQGGHQLIGTAGGEAGVIMGLTCSKWQPSSQRRVSETDSSVVSWRMPGRALRSIFTLPT